MLRLLFYLLIFRCFVSAESDISSKKSTIIEAALDNANGERNEKLQNTSINEGSIQAAVPQAEKLINKRSSNIESQSKALSQTQLDDENIDDIINKTAEIPELKSVNKNAGDSGVVETSSQFLEGRKFSNQTISILESSDLGDHLPEYESQNEHTTENQENLSSSLTNQVSLDENDLFFYNTSSTDEPELDVPVNSTLNTSIPKIDISFDDTVPYNTSLEKEIVYSDNENINSTTDEFFDYPPLYTGEVTVRKCCQPDEYFNLAQGTCLVATNETNFISAILPITYNIGESSNFIFSSSSIAACPDSGEPPRIATDVTSNSYLILESGEVYDLFTQIVYHHTHYCLELVGADPSSSSLTLAFCPTYYEDYIDYDQHSVVEQRTLEPDFPFVVRKCCGRNEYFNTEYHKCSEILSESFFPTYVQSITYETKEVELEILSSRLKTCPNGIDQPSALAVKPDSHRLLFNGEIIDISSQLQYNYTHYCLELVGTNETEHLFMIAICPTSVTLPKCCPINTYFDEVKLDCVALSPEISKAKYLLKEFTVDKPGYELLALSDLMTCSKTNPKNDSATNLNITNGELCSPWYCLDKKHFCIEYLGDKNGTELKPMAFFCPQTDLFVKCCPESEVLSDSGCVHSDQRKTSLLKQLTITKKFINSFDSKNCKDGTRLLLDKNHSENIVWWVSDDGHYLAVNSNIDTAWVEKYCVDDYMNEDKILRASAYVCKEDVAYMIPEDNHFQNFVDDGSIGKCCPKTLEKGLIYHFNDVTVKCELSRINISLKYDAHLKHLNFVNEHFHDFPKCPEDNLGYHAFPLVAGDSDHATLNAKGELHIISKNGKCIRREDIVTDRDYCIEYMNSKEGHLIPSAFVCAHAPDSDKSIYRERFVLVTILLGLSCLCLAMTLVSLFTMRVRRGLTTARKANTLAGRILISFVGSHFIGFLCLSLTQYENPINTRSSPSCYVLAGFIQFFNLATFCWNTSICLESLLLTIHITIPEWLRYFLHSLWAWGFPSTMTLIMFLMNHYRDQLPCGVITPQIATYDCFQSSDDALLVYFYIPILITLVANVSFLLGAKAMRRHQLKMLEKGKGPRLGTSKKNKSGQAKGSAGSKPKTGGPSSGMRIHQNHNAKAESIRLVLWTGGTWFLELAGFIITRYFLPYSTVERWYEYLWYIPTSANSLRGVGIFAIIVLTPEKRKELQKSFQIYSKSLRPKIFSARKTNNNRTRGNNLKETRKRNMSVVTMLSTISSSFYNSTSTFKRKTDPMKMNSIKTKAAPNGIDVEPLSKSNDSPKRKIATIRSISQLESQLETGMHSHGSNKAEGMEESQEEFPEINTFFIENPKENNTQIPKESEEEISIKNATPIQNTDEECI